MIPKICRNLNGRITKVSQWYNTNFRQNLESNKRFLQRKKLDFFSKVDTTATKIAFLQKGIVRSFYTNNNGEEFNKNFFVAPAIIGAYTSLITNSPNKLAQQALTECVILETDYSKIKQLYDRVRDNFKTDITIWTK